VVPDEIIPNVRFLSDRVDDIEIVLFETREFSNIPSTEIVRGLKSLAADHDLAYTVHLPIDIHTGHADAGERRRAGRCPLQPMLPSRFQPDLLPNRFLPRLNRLMLRPSPSRLPEDSPVP
jgi:hypothetical protein